MSLEWKAGQRPLTHVAWGVGIFYLITQDDDIFVLDKVEGAGTLKSVWPSFVEAKREAQLYENSRLFGATTTSWRIPDMTTYYADVRIYSGQDYWSATISLEAQGFSNASRSMEVWQSAVQAASVFDVTVERISTTKTRGTDPIPILAPNLLKDIFTKLDVRKR